MVVFLLATKARSEVDRTIASGWAFLHSGIQKQRRRFPNMSSKTSTMRSKISEKFQSLNKGRAL